MGCQMKVTLDDDGKFVSVKGNRCPKGEAYARDEVTDPKRVVTSSVKVVGGKMQLVSVKTDGTIPKRLILDAMKSIKSSSVDAPVKCGDKVIKDLLNTGVNVVATRTVDKN